MRYATSNSCRQGYTLIELLIVVAVLGLAASLLIPYMAGRSSLETQAAVRRVIADLSFAQSDALAHQEYRRVYFYPDGRGYCLLRITGAFDAAFDPNTADYLIDPITVTNSSSHYIVDFTADSRYAGVSIGNVSIDSSARFITYDALGGTVMGGGTLPGTGGYITVTSDEATYRINIAPFTGKLTVEKID